MKNKNHLLTGLLIAVLLFICGLLIRSQVLPEQTYRQIAKANVGAWPSMTTGTGTHFRSISFVNPGVGFAASTISGNVWKTENGGTSWSSYTTTGVSPYDIYFVNELTGWAAGGSGSNGVIAKTTDGGSTWTTQLTDVYAGSSKRFRAIYCLDSSTCWAVGTIVDIHKTTDGGINWVAQTGSSSYQLLDVYFVDSNTGFVVG
ncbi:unnamed protein product, partial [marine sediment metagenome]